MSFAVSRRASTASCRQASSISPSSRRVVSVRAQTPGSTPNDVKPAATPSLQSAMGFSGAAPETINGRLAMVGFVAAAGAELASGNTLIAQLDSSVIPVAATFFALTVASLIPILNAGAFPGSFFAPQPSDVFKPEAEMINGRLAMLGLVALVVTEAVKGSAVFTI